MAKRNRKRDEYGDIPGKAGNQYATMDTIRTDAEFTDVHTKGSIRKGTGTEFWMTSPRPKGWSYDEWEEYTQDRWDKSWGQGEYAKLEEEESE